MGVEKQIRRVSLTVPPERAGQKVDTLLRKDLGLSGTVIRRIKWLDDGILLDGEHVSVDMVRDAVHGKPRKCIEIINCLATIAFGAVVTWSGYIFISQCYRFNMKIIRCIPVPRWMVEICIPLGMAVFTLYALIQLGRVLRTNYDKKPENGD